MNIPDKVKIGGHLLDVEFTNNCDDIEREIIGNTIIAKNIIRINTNYPKSRQEETLIHEIIHNCLYDLKEEQDEAMVERLGTMFYAVIKDNPKVFNEDYKATCGGGCSTLMNEKTLSTGIKRCDFVKGGGCDNEAKYIVTFPDKHVRHVCENCLPLRLYCSKIPLLIEKIIK